MSPLAFHHMQITVTDLERSRRFYRDVLGLAEKPRPVFPFPGAWFELAAQQELHLVVVPQPLWRPPAKMEIFESHIALRMHSFRAALQRLQAHGFSEELPDEHPLRMVVKSHPPTGYPQVYFFDPDRHLVELNAPQLDDVSEPDRG